MPNKMMELRPYQQAAVDALFEYMFSNETGNPLVVLPTGTGKSLVIAEFIKQAVTNWPETRIVVATHVKELVAQNQAEFHKLCPWIDSGIYSAGLKKKRFDATVLFCGIQSVYNKAFNIQKCDVLLVDEAHSVPAKGLGMWRQFIEELKQINPHCRIAGLTATDFRLDTGLLTKREGAIFTDVCYRYGLLQAVNENYLAPVVPTKMVTKFDLSKVGTRNGDYKQEELEAAVNVDEITHAAITEIEQYGADRKSWLIFSAGNDHAFSIHCELIKRGYIGQLVTQDTPRIIRDQAVIDIKSGSIRYIVNNKIFTTGFNAPNIDLIADMGPTQSPGLHVQKLGRGMRLHDSKSDCLVLDFARNAERHGPLDKIRGKEMREGNGEGDAPVKVCPECHEVCFAGMHKCFSCGFEFPRPALDIKSTGGGAPLLSNQIEPEWIDVLSMRIAWHRKPDKPLPVMKVEYTTLKGRIYEWICFEHGRNTLPGRKAEKWHRQRLYKEPVPEKVADAILLPYPQPVKIKAVLKDKFYEVLDWDFKIEERAEIDEDEAFYEIPF